MSVCKTGYFAKLMFVNYVGMKSKTSHQINVYKVCKFEKQDITAN